MERKLIELAAEREAALNAAQAALDAQDEATYNSEMERVQNMNAEIARIRRAQPPGPRDHPLPR